MKNTFTLFDIQSLIDSFNNATIDKDCLKPFLDSYTFENIYETDDDSLVFDADGENRISIEFFNFNHPLKRTMQVLYWENNKPVILYL